VNTEQEIILGDTTCSDIDTQNEHLSFDAKEEAEETIIVIPELGGEVPADYSWPDAANENNENYVEDEDVSLNSRRRKRKPAKTTNAKLNRSNGSKAGSGKVRKREKNSHQDLADGEEWNENDEPSTAPPSSYAKIEVPLCKNVFFTVYTSTRYYTVQLTINC
jgi:hypothetical protein